MTSDPRSCLEATSIVVPPDIGRVVSPVRRTRLATAWSERAPGIVGVRVIHRIGIRRALVGFVAFALVIEAASMIAVSRPDLLNPTAIGTDSSNYYAAAQRLNDGHSLYALSPGDRDVPVNPPYWTVPLLSPPLIVAVWRPLALLGDPSMWIWWAATIAVLVGVVVSMLARATVTQLLLIFLLAPAIALTMWSGNMNALVVALVVATWRASAAGRPRIAGALVAVAAGLKLTPVLILWWFVVRRDVRGIRGFVVAGAGVALVSLLVTGLQNHLAYLDVMRDTALVGATPWSVAGFLENSGLSHTLATSSTLAFVAVALAGVWLLRAHRSASFALAVVAVIYGSPVVMLGNLTLLLAAIVPWERVRSSGRPAPDSARLPAT